MARINDSGSVVRSIGERQQEAVLGLSAASASVVKRARLFYSAAKRGEDQSTMDFFAEMLEESLKARGRADALARELDAHTACPEAYTEALRGQ